MALMALITELLADAIDPLLALLALVAPALRQRGWRRARSYYLAGSLGMAVVYGIWALDAVLDLWARWGMDYSTHTAFAVSAAISLGFWMERWRQGLVAVVVGYAFLLRHLGYHDFPDMATSAGVAATTALFHRALRENGPS